MEDGNHEGTDDTDELLCTDVDREATSGFSLGLTAPCRDHCDLLLDAIDDQLSRLQTHGHGHRNGGKGNTGDILLSVHLERATSVSKDSGLGTANFPTDKATAPSSGLNSDPPHKPTEVSRNRTEPAGQQEEGNEHVGVFAPTSWQTIGTAGPGGSRSEQCLWRLERLLGAAIGVTGKEEEAESVCTEDFSSRFQDVMLEVPEPSANGTDSVSSDTVLLPEAQTTGHLTEAYSPRKASAEIPIRHLAGVQMRSLDLVTTDSDLDSVCTEQLQRHIERTLNNKTAREVFGHKGSPVERSCLTRVWQQEEQMLSSDDGGEVRGQSVRHCKMPRAPTSIQRRKKRNQNQRNSSTPATPATPFTTCTASKGKHDDKLRMDCSDTELSLLELHQQKAAAVRTAESLREELERAERERHALNIDLSHSRAHTQLLRTEMHKLQAQRDSCVKEVRALQESQAVLQKHTSTCNHDASPHRNTRYHDASPLTSVCCHDDSHHRCVNRRCVSALEREEMDRLVDSAKTELFSEQRRFRHTLESLQERLEEVTQDSEQKEEIIRKLRERCSHLEAKLATAGKHREELQESVQVARVEQEGRVEALEKMVAQKEMLLLDMLEEKSSLEREIRAIHEEHTAKLTAELARAQKEKEKDTERLKFQWTLAYEQEMQQVRHQAHEEKAAALRGQALTQACNTESLHKRIQNKEQEVTRLQEALVQQQEMLRRREEELKRETEEQVSGAVAREQRKWEKRRAESLKEQRGILEEQMQEVNRRWKVEVEQERRSALTLQNTTLELRKRVEELEGEVSAQTAALASLRDEQQAEMERLRTHLQQKAESETMLLKQCMKQSEQEIQDLKAELKESERVHKGAVVRLEQQSRSWAQLIRKECAWIQDLLTANGTPADAKHLSHSCTVNEALQVLQVLRNSLQHLLTSLENNVTSLTHTTQQLSADKMCVCVCVCVFQELELRLQKEQLTAEKESALNSLKEKLIQEHIEELSCVSRLRLRDDDDDDDDGGSVVTNLRKQLEAKDEELRQVQRCMMQWKEKTTARLSRKFEEDLTSEMERWKVDWLRRRRTSRPRSEQQWRLEHLEGEMRHQTGDRGDPTDVRHASANSASVPDTPRNHDLTSYKVLRHLQSRIRQLQADRQTHTPSPSGLTQGRQATDLSGSYLEIIAPAQESPVSTPFQ